MAVNRVERLLRKATAALERGNVPYAVVGGNAVAAWVGSVNEEAVRATKDVDILLRREELAAAAVSLRRAGLIEHEVLGITVFLDRRKPNPRTGVHVIFEGEKIRRHDILPVPPVSAAVPSDSGFKVIDLPELVQMKLDANRDVDRVHIRDLLAVGLITPRVIRKLPAPLAQRLRGIRATR